MRRLVGLWVLLFTSSMWVGCVGVAHGAGYLATPRITWLASSIPTTSKVGLDKVVAVDSLGRRAWSTSGGCTVKGTDLVTTKPGICRVVLKIGATPKYSATSSSTSLQVRKSTELNIHAAASLTNAFTELGRTFSSRFLNVSVKFNFAGSSTLATQIQQGAPADVVVTADSSNMDKLVAASLVKSSNVATLVNNKLAILVSRGNPSKISTLADLARSGLKVVLCDSAQPCGKYAAMVLSNAKVSFTPASREASASAVVARIFNGEADAGITYITDGLVSGDKVDPIAIPDGVNVVAAYPIAALAKPSTHDASAITAFIAMARGPVGDAIFMKAGFTLP